jgi:hypothetical protein
MPEVQDSRSTPPLLLLLLLLREEALAKVSERLILHICFTTMASDLPFVLRS